MGTAKPCGHAHFAQETAGKVRVTGEGGLEQLEGDLSERLPLSTKLIGPVHHTHRTLTEYGKETAFPADELTPSLGR